MSGCRCGCGCGNGVGVGYGDGEKDVDAGLWSVVGLQLIAGARKKN